MRAAADSSPSPPPPPVIVVIDFVEPAAFRLRAPRVINQSIVRGAAAGPPQICVVWPSPPPREVSLAAAGCLTSCISTSPDGGAFQPLGWRCVDVSLCGCCWIYLGTILRCVGGEESKVLRLTSQGDSIKSQLTLGRLIPRRRRGQLRRVRARRCVVATDALEGLELDLGDAFFRDVLPLEIR